MNRYQEAAQYARKKRKTIKMEISPKLVRLTASKSFWTYRRYIYHEQIDTAEENPLITAIDELIKEVSDG